MRQINMRKVRKLLRSPSAFFRDALENLKRGSKREKGVGDTRPNGGLPPWFSLEPTRGLRDALKSGKSLYLYLPWIYGHTDSLMSRLGRGQEDWLLVPLNLIQGSNDAATRPKITAFIREYPDFYRRILLHYLIPLREHVQGFVFTFDWSPAVRILASVCEELSIPRILIPHEGVFASREKYYVDDRTLASLPLADVILGWGEMQREIFCERGYPQDRFIVVGAPKFDSYVNYQPLLTRKRFCHLYGLDPERKIIVFAAQTLDSQFDDMAGARDSQRRAIGDLLDYAESQGHQVLVRLPPSGFGAVGTHLQDRMASSSFAAVDGAPCCLVSAEETLHHCDLVTSVNSTMLLEGVLMGRPALSLKYMDFDQIWQQAGIDAARDATELCERADRLLSPRFKGRDYYRQGLAWAARQFSVGCFDGKATERIRDQLSAWATGRESLTLRDGALSRILSRKAGSVDVCVLHSGGAAETTQKYLLPMLQSRSRVDMTMKTKMDKVTAGEIFGQWGAADHIKKRKLRAMARSLGRPILYLEDGFIRSVGIGLSGAPSLSVILDDTSCYYDSQSKTLLQRLLNNGPDLSEAQQERAAKAIAMIVEGRVSKYNHAPDRPVTVGRPDSRKILVVDQRFGDMSVKKGLADEMTFRAMLDDAVAAASSCGGEVLVKRHPDAITGGKSSYFGNEHLSAELMARGCIHLLDFDVNPYALFDAVDDVYVATSGMGFEALMAGKTVHCYGMPYYAGWGVTHDRQRLKTRTRSRSILDIFHYAYIECSRYFHPEDNRVVEVEDIIAYIVKAREAAGHAS